MSTDQLLTLMAYLIVAITAATMIFGVVAYFLYKIREKRRAKTGSSGAENAKEIEKNGTGTPQNMRYFVRRRITL